MSPRVTAADRRRDAVALALVLGGVLLFAVAWARMRGLHTGPILVRPGEQAYPIFLRYFLMAAAGVLLVIGGLGASVWAYVRRGRRRGDREP